MLLSTQAIYLLHIESVCHGSNLDVDEHIFMIQNVRALTHWGRVTHACKLTNIGSDDGLSLGQCQAISWTNARILLIGPLGTIFNEISSEIHTILFKERHFKMSSTRWRPFWLGLIVVIWGVAYMNARDYRHMRSKRWRGWWGGYTTVWTTTQRAMVAIIILVTVLMVSTCTSFLWKGAWDTSLCWFAQQRLKE